MKTKWLRAVLCILCLMLMAATLTACDFSVDINPNPDEDNLPVKTGVTYQYVVGVEFRLSPEEVRRITMDTERYPSSLPVLSQDLYGDLMNMTEDGKPVKITFGKDTAKVDLCWNDAVLSCPYTVEEDGTLTLPSEKPEDPPIKIRGIDEKTIFAALLLDEEEGSGSICFTLSSEPVEHDLSPEIVGRRASNSKWVSYHVCADCGYLFDPEGNPFFDLRGDCAAHGELHSYILVFGEGATIDTDGELSYLLCQACGYRMTMFGYEVFDPFVPKYSTDFGVEYRYTVKIEAVVAEEDIPSIEDYYGETFATLDAARKKVYDTAIGTFSESGMWFSFHEDRADVYGFPGIEGPVSYSYEVREGSGAIALLPPSEQEFPSLDVFLLNNKTAVVLMAAPASEYAYVAFTLSSSEIHAAGGEDNPGGEESGDATLSYGVTYRYTTNIEVQAEEKDIPFLEEYYGETFATLDAAKKKVYDMVTGTFTEDGMMCVTFYEDRADAYDFPWLEGPVSYPYEVRENGEVVCVLAFGAAFPNLTVRLVNSETVVVAFPMVGGDCPVFIDFTLSSVSPQNADGN